MKMLENVDDIMENIKTITVRLDADLHKKLKVKAAAVDVSLNEYITSLIADSVDDIDLSGIVGE